MPDRKFLGTARDLREATAISLGFDAGTAPGSSLGVGTPIRPYSKQSDQPTWHRPDASALDAARARLSHFSAKIIFDEKADG